MGYSAPARHGPRTSASLEDFLVWYWEGHFLRPRRDANDLLSILWTWQMGDVGITPASTATRQGAAVDQGQADRAAGREGPVLPAARTSVGLAAHPQTERARVIPGVWGHFAGSGDSAVDLEYIDNVCQGTAGELSALARDVDPQRARRGGDRAGQRIDGPALLLQGVPYAKRHGGRAFRPRRRTARAGRGPGSGSTTARSVGSPEASAARTRPARCDGPTPLPVKPNA